MLVEFFLYFTFLMDFLLKDFGLVFLNRYRIGGFFCLGKSFFSRDYFTKILIFFPANFFYFE